MYLKSRERARDWKSERETSHSPPPARPESGQSQEPRTQQASPMWVAGTRGMGPSPASFRGVWDPKRDRKYPKWHLSSYVKCLNYGITQVRGQGADWTPGNTLEMIQENTSAHLEMCSQMY